MNAPVAKHKSQRSESANTAVVRIAFPFIHKRRTKNGKGMDLKNPRFDLTLLFPKLHADPAQCANYRFLWTHCVDAARKAWPGSVDATGQWVWPQGGHVSIQDGDVPYKPKAPAPGQPVVAVDPNKYAWRRGNWVIEATHMLDPGPRVSIMSNGQVVEIPAQTVNGKQMYKSGDFGIVHLHAYTFENEKFGVNFGFEGVLFMGEGEQIGSGGQRSAAQMFGSVPGIPGMPTLPNSAGAVVPGYSAPVPSAAPVAPVVPGMPQPAPSLAAPTAAFAPSPATLALPPTVPGTTASPSSVPGLPPFPGR